MNNSPNYPNLFIAALLWIMGMASTACSTPCDDLKLQLCQELGSDCQTWQERGSGPLPEPSGPSGRGRSRLAGWVIQTVTGSEYSQIDHEFCADMVHEKNYQSWTLPFAKSVIGKSTPPDYTAIDRNVGEAGQILSYLPFILIPSILLFGLIMMRRAKKLATPTQ